MRKASLPAASAAFGSRRTSIRDTQDSAQERQC